MDSYTVFRMLSMAFSSHSGCHKQEKRIQQHFLTITARVLLFGIAVSISFAKDVRLKGTLRGLAWPFGHPTP